MEELLRIVLQLGPAALASEAAACDALVGARWPDGLPPCHRCGAPCIRHEAHVVCTRKRRPHRSTILVGTPFATKLEPCIRALFLGIRAFALTPRSVSAAELARELERDRTTLWRHLQTLRALLPEAAAHPTDIAAANLVCKAPVAAWARVGSANAMVVTASRPAQQGRAQRLVGESVRTWINGTFHGVSARWLQRYLDEATSRWRMADALAAWLLVPLVDGGRAFVFADVVPDAFVSRPAGTRTSSRW